MKQHISLLGMALVVGVGSLLFQMELAYAGPKSYPMVCRGGGNMTIGYGTRIHAISINFTRAPQSATQQSPGAGQCAWLDRPIYRDEPSALHLSKANVKYIKIRLQNRAVISLTLADRAKNDLIQRALSGQLFYIHAYNSRQSFKITRLGP